MADYNGDLKLVAHQLDQLTKKIDDFDKKMDNVCDLVSRHDEKIKRNDQEINNLRKKSDAWNAGNTIGLLVASALSAFGIHQSGG